LKRDAATALREGFPVERDNMNDAVAEPSVSREKSRGTVFVRTGRADVNVYTLRACRAACASREIDDWRHSVEDAVS